MIGEEGFNVDAYAEGGCGVVWFVRTGMQEKKTRKKTERKNTLHVDFS